MNSIDAEQTTERTCQFLGTPYDSGVTYSFPNRLNLCHRVRKPEPIDLHHQEVYCLTGKHSECIVFQQDSFNHLPGDILGEFAEKQQPHRVRNILFFAGALIIFATIMTVFLMDSLGMDQLNNSSPSYLQNTIEMRPLESPAPTTTSNQLNLIFLLPSKTPAPDKIMTTEPATQNSPTIGPGFSTPFGINPKYLLHQVKSGESMLYIANLYDTTVEVLLSINSLQGAPPIQVDQIIIVQLGATAEDSIEPLFTIELKEETTVQAIAENYAISIETLQKLNDLGDTEWIPAGRWLIIPQK